MKVVIVVFDEFTDIDVFLPWDLLNRVPPAAGWKVELLGDKASHRSKAGLLIDMHGPIEKAREADIVLITSGTKSRQLCRDADYLSRLQLDPARQLIGSMCSGSLILAGLGLLREATTYPTAVKELESFGVTAVNRSFVKDGNVATAAGCLAALELVGWILETKLGAAARRGVMDSVSPVGATS